MEGDEAGCVGQLISGEKRRPIIGSVEVRGSSLKTSGKDLPNALHSPRQFSTPWEEELQILKWSEGSIRVGRLNRKNLSKGKKLPDSENEKKASKVLHMSMERERQNLERLEKWTNLVEFCREEHNTKSKVKKDTFTPNFWKQELRASVEGKRAHQG